MIEKLLPRVLNSSSDNRLKKKTEMNDAYNVVVTEDFNDFDEATDTGNEGVLKPVKGNVAQDKFPLGLFATDVDRRALGSVSDARTGVVYFFVFSENAEEMGVYAYDTTNYFGNGEYVYTDVYTTSEFNFQQDSVVQGDIVHVSGEAGELRPVLYFTDNVNEPRKLDILRAIAGLGYVENSIHEKDLITACPKAPLHPATFEFLQASDRPISDFRRIPGFQFAYQCIYASGEESALSTYSDIAVPPAYLNQGSSASASLNLDNLCRVTVPETVDGVDNFTREIEKIRLLVRRGNTGAFFVVDEIERETDGTFSPFDFYNDSVLTGITTEEEQKQFDSLPKVAQALSVVENRLFYGNYIEGFDEPEVVGTLTVNYVDRPQSFFDVDIEVTPKILPKAPLSDLNPTKLTPTTLSNRTAGYQINTSGLDNSMPVGTVVTFSIQINPGGNFEFYDATKSYHSSRRVGFATNNIDVPMSATVDSSVLVIASSNINQTLPLFGMNKGVGSPAQDTVRWVTTEGDENNSNAKAIYGTSAANAFKIKQSNLEFSVTLRTLTDLSDASTQVRDAICAAFDESKSIDESAFEIIALEDEFTYTYNLGFEDPDPSGEQDLAVLSNTVTPETGMSMDDAQQKETSKLIVAVGNDTNSAISGGTSFPNVADMKAPCGYFIVNQATVQFRLRQLQHLTQSGIVSGFLAPEMSSISGVDVRTCIPVFGNLFDEDNQDVAKRPFKVNAWRVFSKEYLQQNQVSGEIDTNINEEYTQGTYLLKETGNDRADSQKSNRQRTLGYLHYVDEEDLFVTNAQIREDFDIQDMVAADSVGSSFMDGEAGLSLSLKDHTVEQQTDSGGGFGGGSPSATNNFNVEFTEEVQGSARGPYGFMQCFFGYGVHLQNMDEGTTQDDTGTGYPWGTGSQPITLHVGFSDVIDVELPSNPDFTTVGLLKPGNDGLGFKEGDGGQQLLELQGVTNAFADQSDLTGGYRSFKTYANHDFGVVYYDERGRAGNVNRLGSVYVQGYSDQERENSLRGRAEVQVDLTSNPPDWAHHYQFVYAGNSSIRSFIQYTAGGAFFSTATEGGQDNNIYVSLNYLQSNADVSYSGAFGAVAPDGTQNLYVYSPGDTLRIISYNTDETTIVYPNQYLFEVVDVVDLGSNPDENPLHESGDGEVPKAKQGQFVVLKNNPNATNFTFNDVVGGDHAWGDRCIFEIASPKSASDPEDTVYYEIGEVYNVGRNPSGQVYHQSQSVTLQNGDVWWRRVPINAAEFDDGEFLNLIQDEDEDSVTEPRFRNYYLESKTFNDTFPGTDVNNFGKRKFMSTLSNEVRRFSSVTFSDQNDYSTKRLRFTSFNAFNAPFKDLPNEHGNINTLLNFSDALFVVQENKASAIPVSRTVLSDALGQDTLIGSDKILGEQRFYAGQYGSDNNPESVLRVDNNIYFAHKSRGEVYKFNPSNGIQVISQKGMNSFFRDAFDDTIYAGGQIRVVSGYDPLKDEYLISILNVEDLVQPAVAQYTQPDVDVIGDSVTPVGEETEDDGGAVDDDTGGVALSPYSFTFDFSSTPDTGFDGDDYIYSLGDGEGPDNDPVTNSPSYNQTVKERDKVAKWTKLDGVNWGNAAFFATKTSYFADLPQYAQKNGRITSWPENWLEYSTYRLTFDIYFSGVNATEWIRIAFGVGVNPLQETDALVVENEWLSYDTGEQDVSLLDPERELIAIRFQSVLSSNYSNLSESLGFADGGFVALDNVTLTFTP